MDISEQACEKKPLGSDWLLLRPPDSAGSVAWGRMSLRVAAFVLIDLGHEGEAEAVAALCALPEVMERHLSSGAHSYRRKRWVQDMDAVQVFAAEVVRSLAALSRTEATFALKTYKEIAAMWVAPATDRG